MKPYLAGPMSGIEQYNYPAFRAAADQLRNAGYEVVSPAELNSIKSPWAECMRNNIKVLVDCQGLALMPGWKASKGATLEKHIAESFFMPTLEVAEWLERRPVSRAAKQLVLF